MFKLPYRFVPILIGIYLLSISHGLQTTVTGVRSSFENFDVLWIGIIMTSYFAGHIPSTQITPILIRRVGYVRVFAALIALASSVILVMQVFVDPLVWTICRVITGFTVTGLFLVCESWIYSTSDSQKRGSVAGFYLFIVYFGYTSAQLVLNFNPATGNNIFIFISATFSIAAIPLLLSSKANLRRPNKISKRIAISTFITTSPAGAIGIVVIGFLHASIFTMLPVYAINSGFDKQTLSLAMTSLICLGGISSLFIGRFSDSIDRRLSLLIFASLSAITFLISYFLASTSINFIILSAFMGIFTLGLYPACLSHALERFKKGESVSALATILLLNGLGSAIGPFASSVAIKIYGNKEIFLLYFASLIIWILVIIFRKVITTSPGRAVRKIYLTIPNSFKPASFVSRHLEEDSQFSNMKVKVKRAKLSNKKAKVKRAQLSNKKANRQK